MQLISLVSQKSQVSLRHDKRLLNEALLKFWSREKKTLLCSALAVSRCSLIARLLTLKILSLALQLVKGAFNRLMSSGVAGCYPTLWLYRTVLDSSMRCVWQLIGLLVKFAQFVGGTWLLGSFSVKHAVSLFKWFIDLVKARQIDEDSHGLVLVMAKAS